MDAQRRKEIEQIAEKTVQEIGCDSVFPVPIEKIISHLKYKIFKFSPRDGTDDISGAVNHAEKAIYVNEDDDIRRQFFTLAHEIGHIILHGSQNDYIDKRSNLSNGHDEPKEAEANYFAASLLMPKDVFIQRWHEFNGDRNLVSNYFGTSRAATANRSDFLGLNQNGR